ncbi:phosphonoacetaldehyde hydrolase [Paraburkholderia sp. WSM4179]|nr:phosphonoacetaldehyde hydrolase [Paraburkholderia sp. WSM4179]
MALPRIAQAWAERHGHMPTDADIDAVYDVFVPKNIAVAASYSAVIPGVAEVASALRQNDIRIGTTTGYTREIIDEIVPGAAAQGFVPDSIVCTGDTPEGRPSPYMIYRTLPELGVWRAKEAIKVDDTEVGIEEGINAGTWAVGVAVSGNAFGMSEAEVKALPADEFAARRNAATARLKAAGAHYVIDSVADLMPVVYDIDARLARGERP